MSNRNKYVCIHGHFYQPPRENAWLEVVELQDSAAPFHDWNERINFECYAPNTVARILDSDQSIIRIQNNYSKISFNFGPTLLSWMEDADPKTYQSIIDADKKSQELFNGHGSALAQVHAHLILPLANRRDKETQVIWGIRDFEYRFGRKPEGIWLAETAVDTATLEVLAEQGIKYTILAPRQAKAVRRIGEEHWHSVNSETVDTRRPYWCRLPSGKTISLFFYHGGIAQGVAFDGLLNNGQHFAERFLNSFDQNDEPQLVHIATDGESYGHHHKHGEMALASCLNHIEDSGRAQLINYGAYLELFPPTYEAQIHDNSSWSCVHGVERWRSNCGCNSGGRPDWNQEWRRPLRDTLNWLRDELIPIYEQKAADYLKNAWEARNDYISILLDRTEKNIQAFIDKHAKRDLAKAEKIDLMRTMEMQRQSMLMFTSCGWFFDEVSGIETNQILQYANRAIYYANQVYSVDLHTTFLQKLERMPSNVFEDGASSYKKNVVPARVDLTRVGMHYAASSLFEAYPERLEFFNYIATSEVFYRLEAGKQRLALGRTTVKSKITQSEKHFSFAVLYLGQQNIFGNISLELSRERFDYMADKMLESFKSTNVGDVIGWMQSYFGNEKYTIWHLFRDEKRKILKQITDTSLKKAESNLREIYVDNYQLMAGMIQSDIPVPPAYHSAVEFIINHDLNQHFGNGHPLDTRELNRLTNEFKKWNLKITDESSFDYVISERIFRELKEFKNGGATQERLQQILEVIQILEDLPVEVNYWKSQNIFFLILQSFENQKITPELEAILFQLGKKLKVKVLLQP